MSNQDALAKRRAATEKILNRIASDPGYRRALLEDPLGTLEALLGTELDADEEVAGHLFDTWLAATCKKPTCGKYSCPSSCAPGGTCSKSCGLSRVMAW